MPFYVVGQNGDLGEPSRGIGQLRVIYYLKGVSSVGACDFEKFGVVFCPGQFFDSGKGLTFAFLKDALYSKFFKRL